MVVLVLVLTVVAVIVLVRRRLRGGGHAVGPLGRNSPGRPRYDPVIRRGRPR